MSGFTVRRTRTADWREVRALRLEMLADTPNAFAETLGHASSVDDDEWKARAARGENPAGLQVAAVADDGRWIGTMGVYVTDDGTALLVGVYVTPDRRGASAGVTDALFDAVEDWTRERYPALLLHVHVDNPRARAAYERRGFVYTGVTLPYVLDPTELEFEMAAYL